MKLRRCEEDRFDFTMKDNPAVWPIHIIKGGPGFGFCPGKATWDVDAAELYKMLELTYHLKMLPYQGNLMDQPSWFVDVLHWFVVTYDEMKVMTRQQKLWGGGDSKGKGKGGQSPTRTSRPRGARRTR